MCWIKKTLQNFSYMFATKTRERKSDSNNKITISSSRFFHPRLLVKLVLGWNLISFLHAPFSIACSWRCTAFRVSQTNQLSNRCKKFNYCFMVKVFLLPRPSCQFLISVVKIEFYCEFWKVHHHDSWVSVFQLCIRTQRDIGFVQNKPKALWCKRKIGKILILHLINADGRFFMLIF